MKQRLLSGWTAIRIMYLLMGVAMIGYSIKEGMWAGILFGGYFASMGLFSFGCAAGNCYTPPPPRNTRLHEKPDEVVFEEVNKYRIMNKEYPTRK